MKIKHVDRKDHEDYNGRTFSSYSRLNKRSKSLKIRLQPQKLFGIR